MKKLKFLFGIHNHQPVGNFTGVFEEAYQKSYWPFMEVMKRHKKIKWSLHCSGILWDFIVEKHPEYMEAVREMVKTGQLELVGGGYYEPIMPIIPDRDKKGQITKLSKFLEKEFDTKVNGMWLPERVWEPYMAKPIADSGIKYTIVDDAHFASAGMDVEKLSGYYVTEEQGTKLNIFPISQKMRYYIPFQPIEKTIEYFREYMNTNDNPSLVMADDGEKFGLWPETFKHVYEDKWLDNFFALIENNLDWIESITFSEYMDKYKPKGNVYLPTASYFEMSEWSLPSGTQYEFENIVKQYEHQPQTKRFLKGGFWRNFLTKYSESNNMHKKMLHVSGKANDLILNKKIKKSKGDAISESKIKDLLDSIYAGQCNCTYWHGVFGGLYLPHLRNAIYNKLLKADELMVGFNNNLNKWKELDFDCDGRNEIIFEDKKQNIYVAPGKGGSIFEWDFLPIGINLQNVLTRRFEAYHNRLKEFITNNGSDNDNSEVKTIHDLVKVKEKNLDKYLNYDWYNRASLLDHFLHPKTSFEQFRQCKYGEQGDFVLETYNSKIIENSLELSRDGNVWIDDNHVKVGIVKKIFPTEQGYTVEYALKNYSDNDIKLVFAPEFNFAFSNDTKKAKYIYEDVKKWSRKDDGFGFELNLSISKSANIWTFPLETVSLSENGFERTYQGTVVLPVNKMKIKANSQEMLSFEVTIK